MLTEKCIMTIIQIVWIGVQAVTARAEEAVDRPDLLTMPGIVTDFLSMDTEEFAKNNSKHRIGVIWYEESEEAGGRTVFFVVHLRVCTG